MPVHTKIVSMLIPGHLLNVALLYLCIHGTLELDPGAEVFLRSFSSNKGKLTLTLG